MALTAVEDAGSGEDFGGKLYELELGYVELEMTSRPGGNGRELGIQE